MVVIETIDFLVSIVGLGSRDYSITWASEERGKIETSPTTIPPPRHFIQTR